MEFGVWVFRIFTIRVPGLLQASEVDVNAQIKKLNLAL